MTHSHYLRDRKSINWKELCYGESIVIRKESIVQKREVLPEEYHIERLIARKFEKHEFLYLVKWHGFPESDSTWEPTGHIDEESLQNYECPIISSDRLSYAAKQFEDTVQQRLRCKESAIRFDLDVYRYCFLTDEKLLVNGVGDLKRLPMSDNWYYRINDKGRGLKLSFPLTLIPKLQHKKVYFKSNGILQQKIVPFETVRMLSATEVCNLDKL
ncbi:unnamed protein product [Mytilus edulis]|uniref:Chromo domain-containing protein n=1 Tax=Mytilus edulis TaxID=6550 RepID=A0A8S3TBE7_MYTED|nr:unnamed protein product [Mytilus edulis]